MTARTIVGWSFAVAFAVCAHVYLRWQAARDEWDLQDIINGRQEQS